MLILKLFILIADLARSAESFPSLIILNNRLNRSMSCIYDKCSRNKSTDSYNKNKKEIVGCESKRNLIKSSFMSLFLACTAKVPVSYAYTPDTDPVRESLYFISRIQEATVQQERFVKKSSTQQDLRSKMKLTLRLIEKNYKLVDQITFCSNFINSDDLVEATNAGMEAAAELQSAIDFVNSELMSGDLTEDQKAFLTSALTNTREQLFVFLRFVPRIS